MVQFSKKKKKKKTKVKKKNAPDSHKKKKEEHLFDSTTVALYGTVRNGRSRSVLSENGERLHTVPFLKTENGLRLLTVPFSGLRTVPSLRRGPVFQG